MKLQSNERGELNILLIPVILIALLFIAAASFGIWAFGSRQDYKNNSDQKSAEAVAANKKVVQADDAKLYAEAAKQPLKSFVGPQTTGSLTINYPKTWSGYVVSSDNGGSMPLDAYFSPDVVPNTASKNSTFALRVQVESASYSSVLTRYAASIKKAQTTATPYKLPKVQSVVGTRLEGQLTANKRGSMVILPLRDKTIEMWVESATFKADFDNNILPNTTFSP